MTADQSARDTITFVTAPVIEQNIAENGRIISEGLRYINYLREIGDDRHSFQIGASRT